jgi:ABC-type phosphate transport system substrate-binding protein
MRNVYMTLLLLLALAGQGAADPPRYSVIVHRDNHLDTVSREYVSEIFLKRATRWPDDAVIRPVDLPASSRVRREFTEEVLGRSVAAVKNYWQQVVFSGRDVPPPELETDADVVTYVKHHANAIGYVSTATALDGVKVVEVH